MKLTTAMVFTALICTLTFGSIAGYFDRLDDTELGEAVAKHLGRALGGAERPEDFPAFCRELEQFNDPEDVYEWLGPRRLSELRALISCLATRLAPEDGRKSQEALRESLRPETAGRGATGGRGRS